MPENLIYEGPIRIFPAKKDGTPYTYTPRGGGLPVPYSRISFTTPEGQTIYLSDFSNHSLQVGDGGTALIAYAIKTDNFNNPVLYNGALQYNLVELKPTGAPAAPQNGAFSAPATPGSPAPQKTPYNSELGAFQTALNGSVAIEAALITAKVAKEFNLSTVLDRAADFHRYLTTGKTDELDQFLAAGKKAGMEEVVEMPGPDAPLPLDEPGDADIPF